MAKPIGAVMPNSEVIPPDNNVMEYLVVRDEPVSIVTMGGFEFRFEVNEHGHKVCMVPNKGVRTLMIESGNFRHYVPPAAEKDDDEAFINQWNKFGGEKFTNFVRENLELFSTCSPETLEKAKVKWGKFNKEVSWPEG